MKKILLLSLIIVFIPSFIIIYNNKDTIIRKIKFKSYSNLEIRIKKEEDGSIISVPIEEYVIGVVAGEMPANFNDDALKAQAVASRTYALNKKNNKKDFDVTDNTNYQVYLDNNKMMKKWQNNYDAYYKKIKKIVKSTEGEVILYNNNLIDALFFSTSNGYTEDNKDVFQNELPYLKSVKSSWDETESPVFKTENIFSKEEFLTNLGLDNSDSIEINNINKSKTGRVNEITINEKKFTGRKIRSIFGLKSTSFEIHIKNNQVTFNVLGFGHGVGMSQYGANGMAKDGYNYKEILKYYYKDCEIKRIN